MKAKFKLCQQRVVPGRFSAAKKLDFVELEKWAYANESHWDSSANTFLRRSFLIKKCQQH